MYGFKVREKSPCIFNYAVCFCLKSDNQSVKWLDLVSHRPVAALPFVPHAAELGKIVLDIVVDAYILLADVFPVQPSGILLSSGLFAICR